MKEATEPEKQKYQRMIEISDLARQRDLDAGGDRATCSAFYAIIRERDPI